VTRDVPDGATVVGIPARLIRRAPAAAAQNTKEE
jgi:acetyltransferase-like isoleucine patch superfamily enzyme